MYLVDTNVWMEILQNQPNSDQARRFLAQTPTDQLAITDFSVHSICVILLRHKKREVLTGFLKDVLRKKKIQIVRLSTVELDEVISMHQKHHLDFDDSYQFTAASLHGLTLISFDTDFANRKFGSKTPAQILEERAKRDE